MYGPGQPFYAYNTLHPFKIPVRIWSRGSAADFPPLLLASFFLLSFVSLHCSLLLLPLQMPRGLPLMFPILLRQRQRQRLLRQLFCRVEMGLLAWHATALLPSRRVSLLATQI
jgi:hypothetical protein